MKVLITGSSGTLGAEIVNMFHAKFDVYGIARNNIIVPGLPKISFDSIDIIDSKSMSAHFDQIKPDIVIHTAALTNVDECERHPDLANKVNIEASASIALQCKRLNAVLFHVSTDYVFDGKKRTPYSEEDVCNPISSYGISKWVAEKRVMNTWKKSFILRVSWLFGHFGNNFNTWVINSIIQNNTINLLVDQVGVPTYNYDIASTICQMIEKTVSLGENHALYGVYHVANQGECTRYEQALHICKHLKLPTTSICKATRTQLNLPAKRPDYTVLSHSKLTKNFGISLRPWTDALDEYLKDTKEHFLLHRKV